MNFNNVDLPLEILAPPYRTFVEIFRQHFGEDNVSAVFTPEGVRWAGAQKVEKVEDLKNVTDIFVIVHFPQAVVENENGEQETIFDLFVRISPYRGTGITAMRTTFTDRHIISGYAHSHLPRMYGAPRWESWCLGGGPIRNTLHRLDDNRTEPGLIGLLCLELKTLVATESLRGGPYIRMSELSQGVTYKEIFNFGSSTTSTLTDNLQFRSNVVRDWFKGFLRSGKVKLKIVDNKIMFADSVLNLFIDATNDFLWYLERNGIPVSSFLPGSGSRPEIFSEYVIKDGELYSVGAGNRTEELRSKVGTPLITFKGKEYKMAILNNRKAGEESHSIWLFDIHSLFSNIVAYIQYLNEKYLESIDG